MMRLGWVVALVAGCFIGAAVVLVWNSLALYLQPSPLDGHGDLSKSRMADAELARALLDRVAPTFVASDREDAITPNVYFYTAPLPYGDNLCRTDIVSFSPRIVRGRTERHDSRWDDDLTIVREYGVWTTNAAKGETRDEACAKFRDFHHLVSGDGIAIDRTLNVLAKATAAFKAGRATYHVGCMFPDRDNKLVPQPCKASRAAVLDLGAAEFGNVETETQEIGKGYARYVDVLTTGGKPDGHGCLNVTSVRIESRQTYETEGALDPDLVDLEFLPGGPVC